MEISNLARRLMICETLFDDIIILNENKLASDEPLGADIDEFHSALMCINVTKMSVAKFSRQLSALKLTHDT
jgi:hypothetical protein